MTGMLKLGRFSLLSLVLVCGVLTGVGKVLGQTTTKPASRYVTFTLHLGFRDEAELRKLVADQQRPESPRYRQWLSPAEFRRRFAPLPETVARVTEWARKSGFSVVNQLDEGIVVVCQAELSQAAKTFGLTFARKVTAGKDVLAASTAPAMPADIAGVVRCVEGLDTLGPAAAANGTLVGETFRAAALPSQLGNCDAEALVPSDIQTAYGFSDLYARGTTGNGQTIALIVPGAYAASDLQRFQQRFNLPSNQVEALSVQGGAPTTSLPGTMAEIEYAAALAPQAQLKVIQVPTVGSGDVSATDLTAAMAYVVERVRDAKVVSTSLGICERQLSRATIDAQEALLLQAASLGQTWVVAVGDGGADTCPGSDGLGVRYPASSPLVTAVGGTDLIVARGGDGVARYFSELAWNTPTGAGNGGASALFDKPQYQVQAESFKSLKRTVPDVSFHGAGNLAFVFNGVLSCYSGTGGAAAAWAAFFSLVNQAGGASGLGPVNSALYTLGAAQAVERGPAVFNDVRAGNNFFRGAKGQVAGPGYDLVTGWGSFRADGLARNFSAGLPRPGLGVSPGSLDFGTLRIGRKSDGLKLRLSNTGAATLLISRIELLDDASAVGFSLETQNLPKSIEPRESAEIVLSFTPRRLDIVTAALRVSSNAPSRPDVDIVLVGRGSDDAVPPRVGMQFPFNGERFVPGDRVEIKWTASDNVGVTRQTILLSTNGGSSFDTTVVAGLAGNATSYSWTIPGNVVTPAGKLRVQAFDEAQNVGEDQTFGTFSISDRTPPTANFDRTPGGEFEVGETIEVAWRADDNVGIVSQELAVVDGSRVTPLPDLDPSATAFTWTTTGIAGGANLRLRLTVRDAAGNATQIQSEPFDVRPKISTVTLGTDRVTIGGLGFGGTVVVKADGKALSSGSVQVENGNQIVLRGAPASLGISRLTFLVVQANGKDSWEYIVR